MPSSLVASSFNSMVAVVWFVKCAVVGTFLCCHMWSARHVNVLGASEFELEMWVYTTFGGVGAFGWKWNGSLCDFSMFLRLWFYEFGTDG